MALTPEAIIAKLKKAQNIPLERSGWFSAKDLGKTNTEQVYIIQSRIDRFLESELKKVIAESDDLEKVKEGVSKILKEKVNFIKNKSGEIFAVVKENHISELHLHPKLPKKETKFKGGKKDENDCTLMDFIFSLQLKKFESTKVAIVSHLQAIQQGEEFLYKAGHGYWLTLAGVEAAKIFLEGYLQEKNGPTEKSNYAKRATAEGDVQLTSRSWGEEGHILDARSTLALRAFAALRYEHGENFHTYVFKDIKLNAITMTPEGARLFEEAVDRLSKRKTLGNGLTPVAQVAMR